MQASDQQPLTLDASELVDLQDLTGEAEEAEASLTARRRKRVDPPVASEPKAPSVEEAIPSVVVAEVLVDLAPREEVVESHSGVEGETVDMHSFAFDARGEEEPPVEEPIEKVDEVVHAEVEPVGEAPTKVREETVLQPNSPPRE